MSNSPSKRWYNSRESHRLKLSNKLISGHFLCDKLKRKCLFYLFLLYLQYRPAQLQEKEAIEQEQEKENQGHNDNEDDNSQEEENQNDENEEENDKQNLQKSVRKGSSDSIRQSQIENDYSQQQASGGRKCFNKLCDSKKIHKKIRSRVQAGRYRFLCKTCYDNYLHNSFCQFCEQIYSNYENQDQDMNKWVGCDKCERWNHIQCEQKFRNKNFDVNNNPQYQCLACSKKNRNGANAESQVVKRKPAQRQYESTRNYRNKTEISKQDRILIFHKKPQSFPCLEPFLQGYNYRLWINQNLIRQDIEAMRSMSRRPLLQEQPKKGKKIKQE